MLLYRTYNLTSHKYITRHKSLQQSRQAILRPSLLQIQSQSHPPFCSRPPVWSPFLSVPISSESLGFFPTYFTTPHFVSVTNSRNPLTKRSRVGDHQVFSLPPLPTKPLSCLLWSLLLYPHSQGTKQILVAYLALLYPLDSLNLQSQLSLITINTQYLEKHST